MFTKVQIVLKADGGEAVARYRRLLPELDAQPGPPTLGTLRDGYGNGSSEIVLTDEYGLKHHCSIAAFDEMDSSTPVRLQFRAASEYREFPELEPGEVLLKEYLVASGDD